MALRIETFDNVRGGNTLYKALTHPHAAAPGRELVAALADGGPVAIVDPHGAAAGFAEIFGLDRVEIAGVYVQDVTRLGATVLGNRALPLTALAECRAAVVFVAGFDADRLIGQLCPYIPAGARILSLDAMRLPEEWLTNRRSYLDPLNFATNFAFFRDTDALHTRLVTANYWSGYGSPGVTCWLTLFDGDGRVIAAWSESCGAAAARSRSTAARCAPASASAISPASCSSMSSAPPATMSSNTRSTRSARRAGATRPIADGALSCTHDANAWPADRYAGLPAPAPGERVVLWIQNSHPTPIPAGAIGLNPMGDERVVAFPEPIGPFASRAVDVAELLPGIWPGRGRSKCGPASMSCGRAMRSSPPDAAASPTSMSSAPICGRTRPCHGSTRCSARATCCRRRSCRAASGKACCCRPRWRSRRANCRSPRWSTTPTAARWRGCRSAGCRATMRPRCRSMRSPGGSSASHGHVELVYDFSDGGSGDGWLHALFRYRHRGSGHAAEPRFGAHVFNTLMVYRDEPQSYVGRPPGLSTRLFLRLGDEPYDTLCQLIYPASRPWRAESATEIILYDRAGTEIARQSWRFPAPGRACSAIARCSTNRPAPAPGPAPTRSSATRPADCSAITGCWAGTARSASTICSASDRIFGIRWRRARAAAQKNAICPVELLRSRGLSSANAGAAPQQGLDHRRRAGRLYRGDLCGARQPAADSGDRDAAGRPADDHHRCRELSRLRRHHPGPLADGADAAAGRACRHPHHPRRDRRPRSRASAVSSRPAIRAIAMSATR